MKSPDRIYRRRLLLAAAAASCIANVSWWMQPQIVNDVLTSLHTSEAAAGFAVTAEFATMALSSFVIARLAGGISYLAICGIGAVAALAGAAATLYAGGYADLAAARALTGAGEGAFLMVSTAAVAHLERPDRVYGQLSIINICLGAAMSLDLPELAQRYGAGTLSFRLLLALLVILVLLSLPMPRTERYRPPASTGAGEWLPRRVLGLASAVFLVGVASAAIWPFYVVLGLRTGLGPSDIDRAVGYSVLAALPAGVLTSLIGPRFGRFKPMALAMVAMTLAIFVLTQSNSVAAFRIGTCINVAGIYFLIPYFFGFAAAEDATGRAAAIAGGAFLMTGAEGPYVGGALMEHFGASSMAWFMLVADFFGAALFMRLEYKPRVSVAIRPLAASRDA